MKKTHAFAAAGALAAFPLLAQPAFQAARPSPKGVTKQTIGVTDVTVTYSRPAVKGREIWGKLVPYGEVWRTGANEATTITFADDVTVAGQKLAAGTYSLHTLPGKDEWAVIFNSVADQWGSYSYDEKKDSLRVKAKPEAHEATEFLTIHFPAVTADTATLAIDWEKLRVAVPIAVKTNELTMVRARDAVAKAKADDWQTPLQASRWAREQKLPEADVWLEKSIAAKATLGNLMDKARGLATAGKTADAIATAEKALAAAKTQQPAPSAQAIAATEKQIADWKAAKK